MAKGHSGGHGMQCPLRHVTSTTVQSVPWQWADNMNSTLVLRTTTSEMGVKKYFLNDCIVLASKPLMTYCTTIGHVLQYSQGIWKSFK